MIEDLIAHWRSRYSEHIREEAAKMRGTLPCEAHEEWNGIRWLVVFKRLMELERHADAA